MTPTSWALLVFLSLIWGGAFFFAAVAVRELPPLTIVLCRVGLAALILAPFLALGLRRIRPSAGLLGAFLAMGLLNNVVPFGLLFWAQTSIPSGLASILNATTPMFALVIAHVALADERLVPHKLVGVGLGVLGVGALLGGDLWQGADVGTLGIAACLGAAFSYGLAGVFGRRFARLGVPSVVAAAGQLAGSTLLVAPVVVLIDRPWSLPTPSTAVILSIVALAAVSTALAYVVYFRLLAVAGAVNATLVTLLIPVSAILLGVAVLSERLEGQHYVGMGLIVLGLLAIDGRLLRHR